MSGNVASQRARQTAQRRPGEHHPGGIARVSRRQSHGRIQGLCRQDRHRRRQEDDQDDGCLHFPIHFRQ